MNKIKNYLENLIIKLKIKIYYFKNKIQKNIQALYLIIKMSLKHFFKNQLPDAATQYFKEIKGKELLAKIHSSRPMVIMLILVGLFFGCIFAYITIKNAMINKFLKSSAEPPIAVSSIRAENQSWQPKFKASGSLRTIQGIDVTTEIAGMVRHIEFTPGAKVNAGDVLVQLNSDADLALLHSLEALAALAKITYERDKLQYEIKAISKETLDTSEADLKNKVAQVEQQAAMLAKKTIKAPFSGRLGISAVYLGQYVNPGDKVVTLQTFDPIYFDFYVPQQIINKIAVDQIVTITSDAIPESIVTGKITTLDPKADPLTRNVQVEATISNPENKLLPGMFAQVEVNIGAAQQHLTLPQSAISFNPYGELIYLINQKGKDKNGKPILAVKQSFVTVGLSRGDQIAVLSGLKEGDVVVTAGQHKLKNGSVVIINNSIQPRNDQLPKVVNN